jgi:hypothetical protein
VAEVRSRGSLLAGLLAVTSAGLYGLDSTGSVHVDEAVVGASLLVVLGVSGLIRSVTALLDRPAPD